MALSKESEIYVLSEGRRVRWSGGAEVRHGSILEVLCPLNGEVECGTRRRRKTNPWDVWDDSDGVGREGTSTEGEDPAESD